MARDGKKRNSYCKHVGDRRPAPPTTEEPAGKKPKVEEPEVEFVEVKIAGPVGEIVQCMKCTCILRGEPDEDFQCVHLSDESWPQDDILVAERRLGAGCDCVKWSQMNCAVHGKKDEDRNYICREIVKGGVDEDGDEWQLTYHRIIEI